MVKAAAFPTYYSNREGAGSSPCRQSVFSETYYLVGKMSWLSVYLTGVKVGASIHVDYNGAARNNLKCLAFV